MQKLTRLNPDSFMFNLYDMATLRKAIKLIRLLSFLRLWKRISSIHTPASNALTKASWRRRIFGEITALGALKYYLDGIKIFIDAGANTGMTSLAASALIPEAEIWMIEPSSDCKKQLEAICQLSPQFYFFPVGLGAESGFLDFNRSLSSATSQASSFLPFSSFYKETEAHASATIVKERVEICTIDDLIAKNFTNHDSSKPYDIFLHIDVEGFEGQVLEGSIKCRSRIKLITLEYSLNLFEGSYSLKSLMDLLGKTHVLLCALGSPYKSKLGEVLVQDLAWINKDCIH